MASLPQLPQRELSAPPPRPGRAGRTEWRSRSHDVKNRLPAVVHTKDKDGGQKAQTPRTEPKPKQPPSKMRPHPAFQVVQAFDGQLEATVHARPATIPEAQHGLLLLECFGISAQELLSTYNVQICDLAGPKASIARVKPERRLGSKSSTPRTPREDTKAKPLVKRSISMASTNSESEEGDAWIPASSWAVPRRNDITGPTSSALVAVALPRESRSGTSCCRLQYKSHDWVKWGLAVRKDPASWLGQISMPLLLGLEKPVLMCSVERSGPEGLSHKLIFHWSVREDSNKFLLRMGGVLWQYRWRWCHIVSNLTVGSIKKTSPVEWGNYTSAPLVDEWSAISGSLEVSLRYTANVQASMCSLHVASCDWSEWSDSTTVVLGIQPPDPGDQQLEVFPEDDPCRARVRWRSFLAEAAYRLEYRLQLKSGEEELPWKLVAWKEATAVEEFSEILDGLMPNRSYVVRVQARYAGGDGSGGTWSKDLTQSFHSLSSWCDDGWSLPAPQLVPEPTDWASRKGVATQVTRRFALLPDDPDVELEWAVPGQRWEKLSFTAADGIASFDIMKLQYRLGKNLDALIRWTSHGKPGEITWISTGMEVACLGRAEIRADGVAELSFDPVSGNEVASCFQIRCEDGNGDIMDFPPVAIQDRREEIKLLVGPSKLATGRSFRLRLRARDTSSWSPWSPVLTATAPPLPGPRPNSLRASTCVASVDRGYSEEFEEMVAAASQGTTIKLSWEGFAALDSNPVGYHLMLKPKEVSTITAQEVFWDAASCTVSCHFGLQQCEMVLRQLTPKMEYSATLRADGRTDEKAYLSTAFRTGDWTRPSLRPLLTPQLLKDDAISQRNISFQKCHLLLDPRMSLKGPKDVYIYQLQWRPSEGPWHAVKSLELSEGDELHADWHMASDFQTLSDRPDRVQLRMALQDPVAKVLLPEHLWFSDTLLLACGFEQPEMIRPRLSWSKEQLWVELPFPAKWTQDLLAEKQVTRCQVRFQGHNQVMFSSDASPVSALQHVDRKSAVTWFLPMISLPFWGNCEYTASLRLGDDYLWSDWSQWGDAMATALPKIWSKDQHLLATKPTNCKVKLDWAQLYCDLGSVPVECVITMVAGDGRETLIAMTSCIAQSPQKMVTASFRDRLEVAINGFDPGSTYQFILRARAQLPILGGLADAESLSKQEFHEVARSESFQWPVRWSEEWSCMVDWTLPFPRQVLLPDDGELEDSSRRWQGRAVLLAWPEEGLQLEVREESQHTHQVFGWQSCQSIHIRLGGTDYMAACDLPNDLVRFRWRRENGLGPCSDICVAKVATPQVTAELIHRGPRRVRLKAAVPRGEMVTFARIRYKVPGGTWKILPPRSLGKANHFTMEVGEEHGLEPEKTYVFSMQFLAQKRRSQWSCESGAIQLLSPKFPELSDAKLVVSAKRTTSVIVSWPDLQVAMAEFRLDVHQIVDDTAEHRTSILVEAETTPSEAKVFNLWPATEYSAELFLRCVPEGVRRWHPTGLKSKFITPEG